MPNTAVPGVWIDAQGLPEGTQLRFEDAHEIVFIVRRGVAGALGFPAPSFPRGAGKWCALEILRQGAWVSLKYEFNPIAPVSPFLHMLPSQHRLFLSHRCCDEHPDPKLTVLEYERGGVCGCSRCSGADGAGDSRRQRLFLQGAITAIQAGDLIGAIAHAEWIDSQFLGVFDVAKYCTGKTLMHELSRLASEADHAELLDRFPGAAGVLARCRQSRAEDAAFARQDL